jgi:Reverse transcriptase (RNA-dependent DNA polymerase)
MEFFRRGHAEQDCALVTHVATEECALNISVKEALRTRGADAEKVIMQELGQMMERRVWTAVKLVDLSTRQKMDIIRSSMFLKQKVHPDGKPDKFKARLVAGGNQQDKTLYDDLSAPTVSTSAVLTILSVAAHERRKVAVVDIVGAFLNTDMDTGILVHMRLDTTMSGLLCRLDQAYKEYMDTRGCIVARLDKALYRCVESAAL